MIGDDIKIMLVEVGNGRCRIGIECPKHITIHRQEVYDAIQRQQQEEEANG